MDVVEKLMNGIDDGLSVMRKMDRLKRSADEAAAKGDYEEARQFEAEYFRLYNAISPRISG